MSVYLICEPEGQDAVSRRIASELAYHYEWLPTARKLALERILAFDEGLDLTPEEAPKILKELAILGEHIEAKEIKQSINSLSQSIEGVIGCRQCRLWIG